MTLEKEKFTQEVEILSMSMNEEEAKKLYQRIISKSVSKAPRFIREFLLEKEEIITMLYIPFQVFFFFKVLLKLNFSFLICITLDSKT